MHELPVANVSMPSLRTTMTIYGELLDVGGTKPNAHIRSDAFAEDVRVDIDRAIAKKLAPRLYEQIGVTADVLIRDGKVVSGKVLSVLEYEPRQIVKWLSENAGHLGGESFRGVDIEAFIAEQRA